VTPARPSGRCARRDCHEAKQQLYEYRGQWICEKCMARALRQEAKQNGKLKTNRLKDEDE
jgi:superfamily II helicase